MSYEDYRQKIYSNLPDYPPKFEDSFFRIDSKFKLPLSSGDRSLSSGMLLPSGEVLFFDFSQHQDSSGVGINEIFPYPNVNTEDIKKFYSNFNLDSDWISEEAKQFLQNDLEDSLLASALIQSYGPQNLPLIDSTRESGVASSLYLKTPFSSAKNENEIANIESDEYLTSRSQYEDIVDNFKPFNDYVHYVSRTGTLGPLGLYKKESFPVYEDVLQDDVPKTVDVVTGSLDNYNNKENNVLTDRVVERTITKKISYDATISSTTPSLNFGSSELLRVGESNSALLWFNTYVSFFVNIQSLKIILNVESFSDEEFQVSLVELPWIENSVSWTTTGNRNWYESGAKKSTGYPKDRGLPIKQFTPSESNVAGSINLYEIDIPINEYVRQMFDPDTRAKTNYGVIIEKVESGGEDFIFNSSDADVYDIRPEVEIVYTAIKIVGGPDEDIVGGISNKDITGFSVTQNSVKQNGGVGSFEFQWLNTNNCIGSSYINSPNAVRDPLGDERNSPVLFSCASDGLCHLSPEKTGSYMYYNDTIFDSFGSTEEECARCGGTFYKGANASAGVTFNPSDWVAVSGKHTICDKDSGLTFTEDYFYIYKKKQDSNPIDNYRMVYLLGGKLKIRKIIDSVVGFYPIEDGIQGEEIISYYPPYLSRYVTGANPSITQSYVCNTDGESVLVKDLISPELEGKFVGVVATRNTEGYQINKTIGQNYPSGVDEWYTAYNGGEFGSLQKRNKDTGAISTYTTIGNTPSLGSLEQAVVLNGCSKWAVVERFNSVKAGKNYYTSEQQLKSEWNIYSSGSLGGLELSDDSVVATGIIDDWTGAVIYVDVKEDGVEAKRQYLIETEDGACAVEGGAILENPYGLGVGAGPWNTCSGPSVKVEDLGFQKPDTSNTQFQGYGAISKAYSLNEFFLAMDLMHSSNSYALGVGIQKSDLNPIESIFGGKASQQTTFVRKKPDISEYGAGLAVGYEASIAEKYFYYLYPRDYDRPKSWKKIDKWRTHGIGAEKQECGCECHLLGD